MRLLLLLAVVATVNSLTFPGRQGSAVLLSSGSGDDKRGETILTPGGSSLPPNSPCLIPPCPSGRRMHQAVVSTDGSPCGCKKEEVGCDCARRMIIAPELKHEAKKRCDCVGAIDCACAPPAPRQLIEPEVVDKDLTSNSNCGCEAEPECPCAPGRRHHKSDSFPVVSELRYTRDKCGCLHLEICPCREVQYVQPEIKPTKPDQTCNCKEDDLDCACRSANQVIPEIRCPCEASTVDPCPCRKVRPPWLV